MNRKNESEILIPLVYLLSLAFVVRIAMPLIVIFTTGDYSLFHSPDTSSYLKPAEELLSHGRFYGKGLPELFRTPGYPIFLVPGILLGRVETITIALQIILSGLTTYVVFRISQTLFEDNKIAAWSAFVYAIEPTSILYASKLQSETLHMFITAMFAYYLLKYFKTASMKMLLLASVLISASIYIRPAGYLLPIVIVMVLVVWSIKRRKAILIAKSLCFLVCSFLIIGVWQLRNQHQAGFPGFSFASDYILYCYKAVSIQATREAVPFHEMQRRMGCQDRTINRQVYLQNHPEQGAWDMGKIYRSLGKEGMSVILREPVTYFFIHLKGMVNVLVDPGITEYLIMFKHYSRPGGLFGEIREHGLLATFESLARATPIFFGLLALMGLHLVVAFSSAVGALFHKDFPHSISTTAILCILAYYILVSGGYGGYHRFRTPIMPLVCVLSGYGLSLMYRRLRHHANGTSHPN